MVKYFLLSFISLLNVVLLSAMDTPSVTWDSHSLMLDGKRVVPVMGEIHYSRVPAAEWRDEVQKMKEGGVTIIATYVFWNHIEEQEGMFRWDGQRNLRRFIEVCKEENMPVVLRIGPFCHGEVRNGGIPDWMFQKGCRLRSLEALFLQYVRTLYQQIFQQIKGLQWKEGGPIMACQFDNEYRGSGDYLMALKHIANEIGFDLPFYTRTGWPELSKPVPFGEMIPLYGDYADGFWDKSVEPTVGNYYKAFNFKAFRSSTAIGTDILGQQEATLTQGDNEYPYFTCELGGGMATAYHRRPFVYPEDAYSMALVKLGSGSNLLGYYMYHGGTNPEGITYLNENQRTPGTANNDLPVKTYDFQAPIGEFGQTYPQYFMLRKLHLFMKDYGEQLAPMQPLFMSPQDIAKGDDSQLRWAVRTDGKSAFIFVNNYERLQHLSEKQGVGLSACGVELPEINIPAGTMCIFPVNIDGIRYATAQIIARRNGKIYMQQIPGIPTEIVVDGKVLKNLKPKGTKKPVCRNIYLLDAYDAEHLFLPQPPKQKPQKAKFTKIADAGAPRTIAKGPAKVAEAPSDDDFNHAAVYKIYLKEGWTNRKDDTSVNAAYRLQGKILHINYRGDCARLYADGKLIADNFYYGRHFLMGLWRLPDDCSELELRILPMNSDMPVYIPNEASTEQGEKLISCFVM